MTILTVIEGTTKPTTGSVDMDLTECTLELEIAYDTGVLVKEAVVTLAGAGYSEYQINWAADDLKPGHWPAQFVITDSSAYVDPVEAFTLKVEGRVG